MTFYRICFMFFSFHFFLPFENKLQTLRHFTPFFYEGHSSVPWPYREIKQYNNIIKYIAYIHSFPIAPVMSYCSYFFFLSNPRSNWGSHIAFVLYISLISFNLEGFFCFILLCFALFGSSVTLTCLKSQDHLSCRIFHNLDLSYCFLILDSWTSFEV